MKKAFVLAVGISACATNSALLDGTGSITILPIATKIFPVPQTNLNTIKPQDQNLYRPTVLPGQPNPQRTDLEKSPRKCSKDGESSRSHSKGSSRHSRSHSGRQKRLEKRQERLSKKQDRLSKRSDINSRRHKRSNEHKSSDRKPIERKTREDKNNHVWREPHHFHLRNEPENQVKIGAETQVRPRSARKNNNSPNIQKYYSNQGRWAGEIEQRNFGNDQNRRPEWGQIVVQRTDEARSVNNGVNSDKRRDFSQERRNSSPKSRRNIFENQKNGKPEWAQQQNNGRSDWTQQQNNGRPEWAQNGQQVYQNRPVQQSQPIQISQQYQQKVQVRPDYDQNGTPIVQNQQGQQGQVRIGWGQYGQQVRPEWAQQGQQVQGEQMGKVLVVTDGKRFVMNSGQNWRQ